MELDELHVGHAAAGAPGHGDAVARGHIRVAGVDVDLAGAARGEDHEARTEGVDASGLDIENVGAVAAAIAPAPGVRDEIDGDVVLVEVDVRAAAHPVDHGFLDLATGGIGGVDDAAMAVPAFTRKVQSRGGVRVTLASEAHAVLEQPADVLRTVFDHLAHDGLVAQACASDQGVLDMGIDGVALVDHRRDSALGVIGVAFGDLAFGDDGDPHVRRQA